MVGSILLIFLYATPAREARPRMVVTAEASDCSDPLVVTTSRAIARALKATLGRDLVDENDVAARLGSPYEQSDIVDLQHQIEAIRDQYYRRDLIAAEQSVKNLETSLLKAPPSKERWHLTVATRLLAAHIKLMLAGRGGQASEAFKAILRLDPKFQLDVNLYPPSTRAAFEVARKQMSTIPKYPLTVTSAPPGAEAFVESFPIGKTPSTIMLPAGTYAVVVGQAEHLSLPHLAQLEKVGLFVEVDAEFERHLRMREFSCLEHPVEEDPLPNAAKLATALAVQQTVLLSISVNEVRARVVNQMGEKVRDGYLRLSGGASQTDLADFAHFILTGNERGMVVREGGPGQTHALAVGDAANLSEPDSRNRANTLAGAAQGRDGNTGLRTRVLIPTIAGGLLLAASGTAFFMTKDIEAKLANGADIESLAKLEQSLARAKLYQTTSAVLLVAGLASASIAGGLYLWRGPENPVTFSVAAGPEGASFSVRGVIP